MKKILSLILALVLTVTVIPVGLGLNATAANLTDDLTDVATTDKNAYPPSTSGWYSHTDITGGGVKLNYIKFSADVNYAYNQNIGSVVGAFPGTNGFMLQFDGYQNNNSATDNVGNGIIAIALTTQYQNSEIKTGVPFMMIDTNNGTLQLCHGISSTTPGLYESDQTVITSNLLKYANIQNKPFTVEFSPYSSTQVLVAVNINGKSVAGLMTKSLLHAQTYAPSKTGSNFFVAISGIDTGSDTNSWCLNFYGYKAFDQSYTAPTPNAQPNTYTDGLWDYATADKNAYAVSSDYMSVSDISGGGVTLDFTRYSGKDNYGYNQNIGNITGAFPGTPGFTLQFDGYQNNNTSSDSYGNGIIAISFTSSLSNEMGKIKTGVPFLIIDTVNGMLQLCHGTSDSVAGAYDVDQTVITDELLKYQNIQNTAFTVSLSSYDNNYILVTVNVDGNAVAGIMSKDMFFAQSNAPSKNQAAFYITIGGIDNLSADNSWSLNFYGYKPLLNDSSLLTFDDRTVLTESLSDIATASENYYSVTSGWRSITDISGGGVKLNYTRFSGSLPYGYNQNIGLSTGAFPGAHGFMLQFDGYKNNNTASGAVGDGIIAITLTGTLSDNYGKPRDNVPFLQIDTNDGTLKLRHGTSAGLAAFVDDQTLITNDILKYENIQDVAFWIALLPYDDTHFLITVNVNGTAAVGLIKQSLLFAQSMAPKKAEASFYISVGGIDNVQSDNKWQLNFYGYKNLNVINQNTLITAGSVDEVISAIDALPQTASLDDCQAILLAKAMYDSLDSTDKSSVTNASTLSSLVSALNTLRQNQKYKPSTTYTAVDPSVSNQFGNEPARTVYSSETSNGFKAEWRGASYTVGDFSALTTQAIYGALSLDGLRVCINNFSYDTSASSDFWIHFTSGDYSDCWDGSQEASQRMIALRLGLSEKHLEINGAGLDVTWIAGSSKLLSRSNLRYKKLIIEWFGQSNGDYICTITVGSQVVAFTVSADKIANMTSFDENEVRVVIGTANTKAVFNMEVTGIYSDVDSTVQNVMEQISNLPSDITTDAQASTVQAVLTAYGALTAAQKEQVLNSDTLTAARASLRQYNGIDQNGRDADGYYIPDNDDVLFSIADGSRYAWTENSAYGGVHFDFNNGAYGLANSFGQKFVVDDLSIRFDNLHYGNDGAFFLGIESTSSECQIFNYNHETTRYAIYLLIGRNNTIYSTLSDGDESKLFALFPQNKLLSSQNLINKEFYVTFGITSDGAVTVTFTVDGTDFSYTYSENYMKNLAYFDPEDFQIVVHSACGFNPAASPVTKNKYLQGISLDITGINYSEYSEKQQQKIQAVEDAVNALSDTPSLSIEEDVYAVWKQYFNLLSTHLRTGVANASKLFALRDGIFDLYADGSKINEYTQGYVAYSEIDNSSLLPEYVPDSEVQLDAQGWPEWTKDLVITEAVPNKISEGGTLLSEDVEPYLQYLAKTGVNGLWLTPVQDMGTDASQVNYTNYGPHTVDPYITGQIVYGDDWYEVDYDESRRILSEFVDLCHSYNIRIFFDFTVWGVAYSAPLVTEHPDWFVGDSTWGGKELDNQNTDAYDFYYNSVLEFITETGCDGIRWDLEPTEFGNTMVEQLHTELLEQGRKIIFISETKNDRGDGAYTFEQCLGVTGKNVTTQLFDSVFFNQTDLVEAIKNGNNLNGEGQYKYYAYQMSCHDYIHYRQPSLACWAYEFAFSSFIPIFYTGEERNASNRNGSCYGAVISNFNEQIADVENRAYYESVKKLLQLRWQYKDLVNSTVDDHRNTNICSVRVKGSEHINGYARYADNQGLIVVPNVNEHNPSDADFTIELPLEEMGLSGYNFFTLTDLLTGDVITSGTAENVKYFTQNIEHNTAGVYLLTGENCSYSADPGALTPDRINISVSGTQAQLDVYVNAQYNKSLKNLGIAFTTNGSAATVSDYTVKGNHLVFSYTVDNNAKADVAITGTYGTTNYISNTVTVDLERLNAQDGESFTQYVKLNLGDANNDGATNIKDLVRTKKIIAELASQTDNADVSGDGTVAATDLALLAKYIVTARHGIKVNTVIFADDDGSLIEKQLVPVGFGAKPSITPCKYGYTFTGWSDAISDVSSDKTVTAQYSAS